MNRIKISAVIITFNEEKNIARCVESLLPVADEIVVLDSFSTDETPDLCKKYNIRFYESPFEGYGRQKKKAVEFASYDYILSLDADEVLSETLRDSILSVKATMPLDGFSFNRLNNFCGTWIRHCGWYPDKKIRLWNKNKGKWVGDRIHETVKMSSQATLGYLKGDILHYSFQSLSDQLNQLDNFSTIASEEAFKNNKKVYPLIHIVLYPFATFLRMYFLRLGLLDGLAGFMVCISASYYRFMKYSKLYYLNKSRRKKEKV